MGVCSCLFSCVVIVAFTLVKIAPQNMSQNPFSIFFLPRKLIFALNFQFFCPKNRHLFFSLKSVIFLDPPLIFPILRLFSDFSEKSGIFENLRVFEVSPRVGGGRLWPHTPCSSACTRKTMKSPFSMHVSGLAAAT